MGVGMENPTPVQNVTYLEPDSIISSFFVQSLIFGHTLCGLLNKLVTSIGICSVVSKISNQVQIKIFIISMSSCLRVYLMILPCDYGAC